MCKQAPFYFDETVDIQCMLKLHFMGHYGEPTLKLPIRDGVYHLTLGFDRPSKADIQFRGAQGPERQWKVVVVESEVPQHMQALSGIMTQIQQKMNAKVTRNSTNSPRN